MIAVIGNPHGRRVRGDVVAAGVPAAIARSAALAGAEVQVIGKVGEGIAGDAILLSLAADGIGHVALQRDPAPAAIETDPPDVDSAVPIDELADLDDATSDGTAATPEVPSGPGLDAADLELALRYLPDYRVVVIAQPLGADALAAALDAIRWSGAHLVLVTVQGGPVAPALPDGSTILEAPTEDAEGAFAAVVGRYAAALDAGTPAADAFASASGATGWTAVAD